MDARAWLTECAPLVDRVLERSVPPADAPPADLHAAMRHLLFPGGKRFRPALALAAAEAVGGPRERALPVAAAVELVHTYSLVHDDLPCMDDDDERRGRPTVHVAFGEALAVLAGDALQAAAFRVLAVPEKDDGIPPERRLGAVRDLAEAAGSLFLVGGQADDLAFTPRDSDPDHIEAVHARKSAALVTAAVVGGARLAGADPATLGRLSRFGARAGVVFQIADDLLDAGADAGADASCSLVAALGEGAARERAEALLASALDTLGPLGERAAALRELARFALRRGE